MGLATVRARAQNGLSADPVNVEVHLTGGLPALHIVGLPEAAVREAKDRVRAAIITSGYAFPQRRITINLAPADLPKHGGRFDLAIALGILLAQGDLPAGCLEGIEVLGELSLSGALRPVSGALPAAVAAAQAGHQLLLPEANLAEAACCPGISLLPAHHLSAICGGLLGDGLNTVRPPPLSRTNRVHPDLAEVRGQAQAKRALLVAAAGGHSLLMIGPPGAGKSMLAQRLPGLLPDLDIHDALEVAAIRSVSSAGFDPTQWMLRPFRAPHHTSSGVALAGGGGQPRPGEITLAHHGVLFLDELPEFPRAVLDVLRQPLESGEIHIARAASQVRFPARFQLVAAMNPCPCGYLGDPQRPCRCTPDQVRRYRGRLSGPLLDRIDLQIFVPRASPSAMLADTPTSPGGGTVDARRQVVAARERQNRRQGCANTALGAEAVRHLAMTAEARTVLGQALERLALSARGLHRLIKVAQTLTDLEGGDRIDTPQVAEALGYRGQDVTPTR
jgi:magnesium chelatase family protein